MADFIKRGDTWQYRMYVVQPTGKHERINKGGFKTKKEARLAAAKLESNYDDGLVIKVTEKTLASYFKEWYEVNIEPHVRPATKRHYNITINTLEKTDIGSYQLKRITPTTYQKFINTFGKHHAMWTVKKMNAQIRACVKQAVFNKELPRDFTQNVKLVYNETHSRDAVWLNGTQMKQVLAHCLDYVQTSGRPINHYIIIVALLTGLRLGELLGLTWADLDSKAKTITVSKSWDYVAKKLAPTKTKSSMRTISINDDCLAIFKQLRNYQIHKNGVHADNQIFLNHYHVVPTPAGLNKTVRGVLTECDIDIPDFHFHSLRHTHASYLLYSGVSVLAISKRLGHSNTRITLDVYSHMIDEMQNREMNKITDTLNALF